MINISCVNQARLVTYALTVAVVGLCAPTTFAQKSVKKVRTTPHDFPEFVFTDIPGAPTLGMPTLVMGATRPVLGEGMGWASPALFDLDGDGKKDLLIGEFGSRLEDNGIPVGNFVRVYKNAGSATEPQFTDFYNYLRPMPEYSSGTPLSVQTWCCLGFTPRIVDLDQDGFDDIITGQYDPGYVTWFRGSDRGFYNGVELPQFGDNVLKRHKYDLKKPWTEPENWGYWSYTTADFCDLDGDGLLDLITGGGSLRTSKNVGTKDQPSFGRRELLLDTAGNPLTTLATPDTVIRPGNIWRTPHFGSAMVPFVTDWDDDGIMDLLVSNVYSVSGSQTITFFRGVARKGVQLFEPGVVLFSAKDGGKAFPGSYQHVAVADFNGDGVKDLLIGTSVAIMDGKFYPKIAWAWERDTESTGVYSAYHSAENRERFQKYLKEAESNPKQYDLLMRKYYGKAEYEKLAHQGYVYVMLGKKGEL